MKNKEYYNQKATKRNFLKGDVVYLFNPVKKPGQSSKFWCPWTAPWKVTARLSKVNYHIVNPQGNEFVMQVNQLKRAYNPGIWKAKEKKRCYRKQRSRQEEPEEEEPAVLAPGPITIPES